MSGLVFAISTKSGFDARIIRHGGAPFTVFPDGTASNEFRMRLVNRTGDPQVYTILPGEADAEYLREGDYEVEYSSYDWSLNDQS